MGVCETVKIVADNDYGFIIINKSDLSKDDVIHGKKEPEPEPKKETKPKAKKAR